MNSDFNIYQESCKQTAIYPGSGTGSVLALAYCGLGLGEVGEVQGKIKKILRDSNGEVSEEVKVALAAELGDVLWYCASLATELGMNLADVADDNLKKLSSRKERGQLKGSGDDR